jgi:hypothetical protein
MELSREVHSCPSLTMFFGDLARGRPQRRCGGLVWGLRMCFQKMRPYRDFGHIHCVQVCSQAGPGAARPMECHGQ